MGKAKKCHVFGNPIDPTFGSCSKFLGVSIFYDMNDLPMEKNLDFLPTCTYHPLEIMKRFRIQDIFCLRRAKLNLNEMHFLNYLHVSKNTLLVRTSFLIGNNRKLTFA